MAKVLLIDPNGRSKQLKMHDFSNTGMFIHCLEDVLPDIGQVMQVRTLEIDDAPFLKVKVVRVVEGEGFAVEFI